MAGFGQKRTSQLSLDRRPLRQAIQSFNAIIFDPFAVLNSRPPSSLGDGSAALLLTGLSGVALAIRAIDETVAHPFGCQPPSLGIQQRCEMR